MEVKEFDSTANAGMSSEQSRVASSEAAVGEPPAATLNGAATIFAPAAAPGVVIAAADVSGATLVPAPVPTPEGAVAAAATNEVTWTVAAASAPNETKDEQGDKEEVPGARVCVCMCVCICVQPTCVHFLIAGQCVKHARLHAKWLRIIAFYLSSSRQRICTIQFAARPVLDAHSLTFCQLVVPSGI